MTSLDEIEQPRWRHYADIVVGGAMLALAFVGIAASDVSGLGSQLYWTIIAIVFGVACLGLQWLHAGPDFPRTRSAVTMAIHWVGVIAAVELVYLYILAGRLTNGDAGLLNGLVLALGTFLAGVHGSVRTGWRIAVIGVAVGLATLAVAWTEQYLWVLLALAAVVIGGLLLASRLRERV